MINPGRLTERETTTEKLGPRIVSSWRKARAIRHLAGLWQNVAVTSRHHGAEWVIGETVTSLVGLSICNRLKWVLIN